MARVNRNTSYSYSVFGMVLVLVMLGIAALLGLYAQHVSHEMKEQLALEVILADTTSAETTSALLKELQGKEYVRRAVFVSKSDAATMLKKEMGEDFMDILGFNPLYSKFDVFVKEDFTSPAALQGIKEELQKKAGVLEVSVQLNVAASLDRIIGRATMFAFAVAAMLLIFAVLLIFNTIRLAVFSNRTLIKSMLLVGATRWFIMKPYLGRSLLNGFFSTLVAFAFISILLAYLNYQLPELVLSFDLVSFALVALAIFVFAEVVSIVSTFIALRKYLSYRTEENY
jgi:cell division transport system permease protein